MKLINYTALFSFFAFLLGGYTVFAGVIVLPITDPDALEVANFAIGNSPIFYHGSVEEVSFKLIDAKKQDLATGTSFTLILEATDNAVTVPKCTIKQFGVLVKPDRTARVTADATLNGKCTPQTRM